MFNSINLSKSVSLCILKSAQWRRNYFIDSVSIPQLQRGSTTSWKLCLNLCSFKCLKPSFNLGRYFLPTELWILKILFGFGLMNSGRHFLNNIKIPEFLIKESNLFHSNTADRKKVFLKYSWFTLKDRLLKFMIIFHLLLVGTKLRRYGSDSVLMILKIRLNFLYQRLIQRDYRSNFW